MKIFIDIIISQDFNINSSLIAFLNLGREREKKRSTAYTRQSYATAYKYWTMYRCKTKTAKEELREVVVPRKEVCLTLRPHCRTSNPWRFSITSYLQPNTLCVRGLFRLSRSRAQQSHCPPWAQKWEAETDGNGERKWQAGCGTAEWILPPAHIRIRPVCQLCASFCVGLHLHNSKWAKTKHRNRKNLGEGRDVWSL